MKTSDLTNNELTEISTHTLYISVSEAVKLTGIGRNKMLKFAKMKGFPAIITPHKIQIDSQMLPIWLRKHYGNYKC